MKRATPALVLLLIGCPAREPERPPQTPATTPAPSSQSQSTGSTGFDARDMAKLAISAIPAEVSRDLQRGQLALRVPRYQGDRFGELSERSLVVARSAEGLLTLKDGAYVPSLAAVRDEERACSFVVDCEEPVVADLFATLRERLQRPSPLDLVRFVDKTIEHKHSGRGYDIASVVARRREGDCTEHAVLLAAVLRLAGFPSHLVTGIALFTDKGQPMAFGHAWVEYHDGQAWQLADASNPPSIVRRMRYVPLELRPEGPNAGRMSFEGFRMVYVEGIVVPPGFSAELPDEPGLSG